MTSAIDDLPASKDTAAIRGGERRVLLVSYTFPPVGGAGVQRVAKFAKFLPGCGWDVSILTAENPSVPLFDESLLRDVPPETVIRRAKTWEPGYALKASLAGQMRSNGRNAGSSAKKWIKEGIRRLAGFVLQPDPQILWKRNAIRAGMRLLQETPHDVILVSGPPFSAFLIGRELSRRSRLPLVVDYRDEWDLSNMYWENKRLDRLTCAIQKRMQTRVLRSARGVVATTRASADSLRTTCRKAGSHARVECIFNGYDPDDFHGAATAAPASANDRIVRLAYLGTLWNLTTFAPLVTAFSLLRQTAPETLSRLRLVVAGRRTPAEQDLLGDLRRTGIDVEEHAYVDHSAAIEIMSSADQLCVTLAGVPGTERVIPAKVFEYMAVGRPILAIAPRGELWNILEKVPRSCAFEPADVPGIAQYLKSLATGSHVPADHALKPRAVQEFDREYQTRRLAEILTAVAAPVNGDPSVIDMPLQGPPPADAAASVTTIRRNRSLSLFALIATDLRAKAQWCFDRSDWKGIVKALLTDGTAAMVLYRLMQCSRRYRLIPFEMIFNKLNGVCCSCIIGRGADFGPGFVLIHSQGVVINGQVRGGSNIFVEQQVTIGAERRESPQLGNDIFIGAGAKIIGAVTIGDGARVGANAVVVHDVGAGATVVGIPARVVRQRPLPEAADEVQESVAER